ncbi:hypothetical protein EOL71_03320 [Candidatus Saccharibacteria bacterium]|nr:hypothetical protein [Candidatus Saccharibacteria bacterium]
MTELGKQKSTVRPQDVEILETKVFLASNIEEVTETIGEEDFNGFQFDLTEYTKDEYIRVQAERNQSLEGEVTSTQLALCAVYELLG